MAGSQAGRMHVELIERKFLWVLGEILVGRVRDLSPAGYA